MKFKKIAFLFPGQGAQYVGMAKDFIENFAIARHIFEEADDILKIHLSKLVIEGPENILIETKNSQAAIFVVGIAISKVLKSLHPNIAPFCCAGLSLGEYTALTTAGFLSFESALRLVQFRGQVMQESCEKTKGTMAVVLGLSQDVIEQAVRDVNLPHDLWIANYNCPGQIVISGTLKGIEAGTAALMALGAKRVLPLQVSGAFHSGLMDWAQKQLAKRLESEEFQEGSTSIVMNVPGDFVSDVALIKKNLIAQVTASVKWEQGIRAMQNSGIDLFIEFGPGKTLSAMNKRIGTTAPIVSIEKVVELQQVETL